MSTELLDRVFNEDAFDTVQRMPDNFLDLTVTSPPYNVDLGNNKYNKTPYDLYIDNMDHSDYIADLSLLFHKLWQKTKHGGRLAVNIGDGKNGAVPTHSDLITALSVDRWIPMTIIVWNKGNANNRSAWGSFMSPSSPSFPRPFEYILVFCKGDKKLQWKGETDLTKEEFVKWAYGLWEFPGTTKKKSGHPAAFPIELPTRLIKMLTWKNSVVYDPFMGSGSTAIACKNTSRHYIGSEISSQYCDLIQENLNEIPD